MENQPNIPPAFVDSLDAVPEPFRPIYQAVPGPDGNPQGYAATLPPANGYAVENVQGLKSAAQKASEKVRSLEAQLRAFEGVDPNEARALSQKVEEMSQWTPDEKVQQRIKAHGDKIAQEYEGKLTEANDKASRYFNALDEALRVNGLKSAIRDAGGNEKLLLHYLLPRTRLREEGGQFIHEVLGDDDEVMVRAEHGVTKPASYADLVAAVRKDPDMVSCFRQQPSGGGASANGSSAGTGRGGQPAVSRRDLAEGNFSSLDDLIQGNVSVNE